ncbi:4Fe-4S binding protein [bacterium]|nr:4Fe-4S binding protein [bacterium]
MILILLTFLFAGAAYAAERFPPPDLGPSYSWPQNVQGLPRAGWLAFLDMAMLLGALIAAGLIVYKWRSRRALVWLSVFSLGYFGFFRKGCICPIGSIQNVAQGLFDPGFVVPIVVIVFFALPVFFALAIGRVFCGGVCPHGALQELLTVKRIRIPDWLAGGLGMLRYFYLGFAVLLAATGTSYFICQYDPFISFFRMSARFGGWILAGAFLLASMIIYRPYCRFLCPYGAILGICSRFALKKVRITSSDCALCDQCREECPMDSIRAARRPVAAKKVQS